MSDLGEILGEEPVEEQVEAVEEAPAVEESTEEPVAVEEAPAVTQVPLAALHDERSKRQELESRINAMEQASKPKEEPVDWYADPAKAQDQAMAPVMAQMRGLAMENSRIRAEMEFGKEKVDAAYAYFDANPQESQALLQSDSPFHAAVEAHTRHQVQSEVGNDPVAYREKIKAELLAELKAELGSVPEPVVAAPPSMASETSVGARSVPNAPDHVPLGDIIGD